MACGPPPESWRAQWDLSDNVAPVQEPNDQVAALRRRRSEPSAERQTLARRRDGLHRRCRPGIDFVSGVMAHRKSQPRNLDRRSHHVDDRPLDQQTLNRSCNSTVLFMLSKAIPRRLTGKPAAANSVAV